MQDAPTPSPLGPPAGGGEEFVFLGAGDRRLFARRTAEGWQYRPDGYDYQLPLDEQSASILDGWANDRARLTSALATPTRASGGDSGADERARLVAAACELRRVNDALDDAGVGCDVDDATRVRRLIEQRDYARSVADATMATLDAERQATRTATPAPAASAPAGGALGDVATMFASLADSLESGDWTSPSYVTREIATLRALADALAAVPVERLTWEAEHIERASKDAYTHKSMREQTALAALLRRLAGEGAL